MGGEIKMNKKGENDFFTLGMPIIILIIVLIVIFVGFIIYGLSKPDNVEKKCKEYINECDYYKCMGANADMGWSIWLEKERNCRLAEIAKNLNENKSEPIHLG
jgi:hypothetical protein